VRDGVITDDTVTAPASLVGLLEKVQPFGVQLLFIPLIPGEEPVGERVRSWSENMHRDPFDGLVAASNKTCYVGLSVVLLPRRKALEVADWFNI